MEQRSKIKSLEQREQEIQKHISRIEEEIKAKQKTIREKNQELEIEKEILKRESKWTEFINKLAVLELKTSQGRNIEHPTPGDINNILDS